MPDKVLPKRKKKRILIVGSWAKEQIMIENIRKNLDYEVFAYVDTNNPGILSLVVGSEKGRLSDIKKIVSYAKEIQADLVVPTTAVPLSLGLIDALEEKEILSFGPSREAAKLETDKAFTRNLLNKYNIHASPKYKICNSTQEALEFSKTLNFDVVLKPIGLTEGLGVQMFGEQFKNEKEIKGCIDNILKKKAGSKKQIIVEEKLIGKEFTLQCLVNDDILVPTPAVRDYKKLLPGGRGPNTASMGAYSEVGFLLPFIKKKDYSVAEKIMRDTCKVFKEETGKICRGFLYGQFMKTEKGIKLIEYNFRPGDPEWLNTVFILKDNIVDKILKLLRGVHIRLRFEAKATVCRYIVPEQYPKKLNQILDVEIPEERIREKAVKVYYSCGLDEKGKLNVGSERGVAVVAKDEIILKACEKIENAVSLIKGRFHCRGDVGRRKIIKLKDEDISTEQLQNEVDVRQATEKDFLDVYKFISSCPVLENYSEHFYRIMLRYFGNSSFIAEYKKEIIGFVLGLIPSPLASKKRVGFIWQIGVSEKARGMGLASLMIEAVEKKMNAVNCKRIELTIDPQNKSSQKLFEKKGYKKARSKGEKRIRVNNNNALKDFYGLGVHFMLYEKKL